MDVSSEWESIDASEFVSELAAPNVITDPFKQRWKDIKSAYQSISNYKAFKTYDLKPVIDKGQIELPMGGPWDELKRQLLIYTLDDKKLEQDW